MGIIYIIPVKEVMVLKNISFTVLVIFAVAAVIAYFVYGYYIRKSKKYKKS